MIKIRLLDEYDINKFENKLNELTYVVLKENISESIPESLTRKYINDMKKFIKNDTAIILGAFDKDKLIGFHWGYQIININEKRIHSNLVSIDFEYRNRKIGSMLLNCLEQEALKRDIHIIEAMCTYSNKVAVDYHLHNGFEIERLKVKKVLK